MPPQAFLSFLVSGLPLSWVSSGQGTLIPVYFVAAQHTCIPVFVEASQLCLPCAVSLGSQSSSIQANLGGASGLFLPSCGSTAGRDPLYVDSILCMHPALPFGSHVEAVATLARACHLVAAFLA